MSTRGSYSQTEAKLSFLSWTTLLPLSSLVRSFSFAMELGVSLENQAGRVCASTKSFTGEAQKTVRPGEYLQLNSGQEKSKGMYHERFHSLVKHIFT